MTMNKPLLISGSINAVLTIALVIAILLGVRSCHQGCPPESVSTVISYRDSIIRITDTVERGILSGTPKLVKTTHPSIAPAFTTQPASQPSYAAYTCTDTNFYSQDTLVKDSYKASASAIVSGNQLLSWDIKYLNLTPEKVRIETVTTTVTQQPKSAMFKVYAGAFAPFKQNYWGLGLKADLVINDGYMVGYGFDFRNYTHNVELLMKINFKK